MEIFILRRMNMQYTVTVNGEVILDGDIRQACQGHNVAPDGGKNNPYTVDHKNHPGLFNASGHIGLLGHGVPESRNCPRRRPKNSPDPLKANPPEIRAGFCEQQARISQKLCYICKE